MHSPSKADLDRESHQQNIDPHALTLAAFVRRNRVDLIASCAQKVAQRYAHISPPPLASQGVPKFLKQLVDVLEIEQESSAGNGQTPPVIDAVSKIGRTAALHGVALLQEGFTVQQVVHQYGDVCQAVTELALAQNTPFSTDEFRILNRSLDDAIAAAVSAHQSAAHQITVEQQASQHQRLHMLVHDHQRLVSVARQSFSAIKSGNVGVTGATGTLLAAALDELLHLSQERLPRVVDAIRQSAEKSSANS